MTSLRLTSDLIHKSNSSFKITELIYYEYHICQSEPTRNAIQYSIAFATLITSTESGEKYTNTKKEQ